ncbi:MAG: energy-coupling factor transporter transmembrane protein EcfT [Planctomycetales bacterium]|nr:energy-coupling factor transporter transmembrane protein EcfT [Planctomycetales bacterium]MBN8625028.1 energy-coupling factor transporter transmembrane protein EcfT [Planctomycetota bacterium]
MNGRLFGGHLARPWLASLDPRVKLLFVFSLSIAVVCVNHPAALAACCATALFFSLGLRWRRRGVLAVAAILALVIWSTMLSQGFFYAFEPRTILFTIVPARSGPDPFPGVALSVEGLQYGAIQSLRLIATMLAGLTTSLSTGPQRMLVALSALRVPRPLAFMTATALRFLPLLIEEVALVRQARRYRGYRFSLAKVPQEVGVLLPVIASALRRAENLAESVTARGFDARRRRTSYPPLKMNRLEQVATGVMLAACAGLITYRIWRDWL